MEIINTKQLILKPVPYNRTNVESQTLPGFRTLAELTTDLTTHLTTESYRWNIPDLPGFENLAGLLDRHLLKLWQG